MNQKRLQTILAKIKSDVSGVFNDDLAQAILFGSHARGDDHSDSDIDLLLVLARNDGPTDFEKKKLREISDSVFLEFDTVVQMFSIPGHLYRPEASLFLRTIDREGIQI